jgi:hypothetical protein
MTAAAVPPSESERASLDAMRQREQIRETGAVTDVRPAEPEERERIGGGLPAWEDPDVANRARLAEALRVERRRATREVLDMVAGPVGISVDDALGAIERIYR